MKPRRKRSGRMQVMRLWDWSEVTKAVPYIRSVIASLREHWLEVLNFQSQLDRSAKRKAPAKRQQLLEKETRQDERRRAQAKFDDALEELNRVDAFLLDPVKGLALIPFRKEDDRAWYVFDHFASRGLIGWRHDNDPIEACRPLSLLHEAAVDDAVST
jgi:hypothetical protein